MIDERNLVVSDVTAVLPDKVLNDASIVIRDGVIVEVTDRRLSGTETFDGHGALCIPGIVDTHSDALEKEMRPRPGVVLDIPFALRSFEGRARAAGVTTMFHGVGFEENGSYDRTVAQAEEMCCAIDERAASGRAII
ncbi:MAG: alpha-D-ribose 1-methylphosphonate 5-triphosphate diphosphatase, partial [Actinomycetota bacterium]|nr:alpha-D-ribose 1-methylphosphonate 5-triphosphate diphosphatase [Actinomycetota bacterium]